MISVELGDIYLTVDQLAFEKLKLYIQDLHCKPESGGILMGYFIDEFSYYITDITIPSKSDKYNTPHI